MKAKQTWLALAASALLLDASADMPPRRGNLTLAVCPEITQIHMLDVHCGWARADEPAGESHVLRTVDGGRCWLDVSPSGFTNTVWNCFFLTTRMAWISFYEGKTRVFLTTDAGHFWMPWLPLGPLTTNGHNYFLGLDSCRLFNAKDGVADSVDCGAGTEDHTFFETHNGGLSWALVPLLAPGGPESAGNVPIPTPWGVASYGGGLTYRPPGTVVIARGDEVDQDPAGVVRLSASANRGKSWQNLRLPLPDQYRDGLNAPCAPHFFDRQQGLMPVCIFKMLGDTPFDRNAYSVLAFYSTGDGGLTWKLLPTLLNLRGQVFKDAPCYASAKDIFIRQDAILYVTHDGARTWRTINLRKVLSLNTARYVWKLDFVDATHGWVLVLEGRTVLLYRTSDGGQTWSELTPKIY